MFSSESLWGILFVGVMDWLDLYGPGLLSVFLFISLFRLVEYWGSELVGYLLRGSDDDASTD